MSLQRLNPNADVSVTGWESPAFSQLNTAADLAVTDPAAGNISTAAEHIVSQNTGDVVTLAMETFDITGQEISQIVARIYSRSGTGGTLTLELLHGSTVLASNTQTAGNTAGWLTATYNGALTQAELDDLRIRITLTVAGTANARVGVAYADVTYDVASGSPPVNTVAPAVTGTPNTGSVLSCSTGTWTGDATITYTYQWQRAGVNIGGETANTYTLVEADEGNAIRCVVTGTNGIGNSSANSNSVTPLEEPVNSVAPAISGTPETGQTVTCSTGTWSNTPTGYTYQWKRDTGGGYSDISGETASTYLLDVADEGASVKCTVVASNANGAGTATDSNVINPTAAGGAGDPTCFIKWGGVQVACVSRVKFGGVLYPPL